jgi:hypothetical protein
MHYLTGTEKPGGEPKAELELSFGFRRVLICVSLHPSPTNGPGTWPLEVEVTSQEESFDEAFEVSHHG